MSRRMLRKAKTLAARTTRLLTELNRVLQEERYAIERGGQRIRDVNQGPDGLLYLLTDYDDGRVLRLEP